MTIELAPEEIAEIELHYAGYTLDGKYKKHHSVTRKFGSTGRHVRYTTDSFGAPLSEQSIKLFEVYTV